MSPLEQDVWLAIVLDEDFRDQIRTAETLPAPALDTDEDWSLS